MVSDNQSINRQEIDKVSESTSLRQKGKLYLYKVAHGEKQLQASEKFFQTGKMLRRAIDTILRDVLQKPSVRDAFVQAFDAQRGIKAHDTQDVPGFVVEDKDEHKVRAAELQKERNELLQKIEAFLEGFPIVDDLNEMFAGDEKLKGEVFQIFRDVLVSYVKANTLSDTYNKNEGGQLSYSFDKFLSGSVNLILQRVKQLPQFAGTGDEGVVQLQGLPNEIAQLEAQSEMDLQDSEMRTFSLLNWVIETIQAVKTEGLRVFDTASYKDLFNKIEAIADQRNGLAGGLLFGPPGTGKTEILIEANKRLGFDTRVVSVHHYSDFVQFIGEKPIPVGMDRKTSQVQRLQTMRESIRDLKGQGAIDFISTQFNRFTQAEHTLTTSRDFIKFMLPDEGNLFHEPPQDEKGAEEFMRALTQRLTNDIVAIGLGTQAGLDDEIAWVYGEILQGFRNNKRIVLDEMDKASEHSLDGISRLLNLSPGQTMPIGSENFTIPSWGRIDGTANAMNVQPFLHDRFTPNILFVDYPPSSDLLQMALVWLSDEQGNLKIPEPEQAKVVGLLKYAFPEIQKLYPDNITYPLSLRGVRKFCQTVANGRGIPEAVDQLLFRQGALATNQTEFDAIRRIMNRFSSLTSPELTPATNTTKPSSKLESLFNSPLYAAAAENFSLSDRRRTPPIEVAIDAESRAALSKFHQDKGETPAKDIEKSSQVISLEIDQASHSTALVSRIEGQLVQRMKPNEKFKINDTTEIVGADAQLENLLLRTNNHISVVDLRTGLTTDIPVDESAAENWSITPNGKFLVMREDQSVSLVPINLAKRTEFNDEKDSIHFIDAQSGKKMRIKRYDFSTDGRTLLIEGQAGSTFLIDLSRIDSVQQISLSTPFAQDGGWMIEGSILFHPQKNLAYFLG
ncbi:MAG: hypothetical protein UU93_C0014G0007 [Candidatus Amesbacteria bacterium GW2011_GWA2_42_12]|uniref:Uncharacterized protein n=1 Tax=Candidatus Amesbacteria bacterium GW2011_GWA2_42_12 TaxID=1618356 RepID=A0A0G0Y4N1_9BACT|nr:MAG: hypothetical protein UU93_C0014G0007 [Candidatus Amesbacteria bacterium GW2011_GWA2_42_12]